MSHRTDEKAARREARRLTEEAARRAGRRQAVMRRAGYGVVGVMAVTLVALAVVLGGGGGPAPAGHEEMGSAGAVAQPGAAAPAFALTDVVSGNRVTSTSLRGRRTLLFFSEGVSCQACLVQIADLQAAAALKQAGIGLVSVTTDPAEQLAQAARQYGIRTPLLADPTTAMSAAYGMLGHGGMGHAGQDGHAFMLLDADGTVRWHRAYQEMYVKPGRLLADMRGEMA